MNSLDSAERKGRRAAREGKTEDACPYKDRRTDRGAVTWSRSFIRAWLKGHRQETDRLKNA